MEKFLKIVSLVFSQVEKRSARVLGISVEENHDESKIKK